MEGVVCRTTAGAANIYTIDSTGAVRMIDTNRVSLVQGRDIRGARSRRSPCLEPHYNFFKHRKLT